MASGDQDHGGPPSHHGTSIMTWPGPGCNEPVEFGVMRAVENPGLDRPRATGKPVDVAFPAGSATPNDIGLLTSRTPVVMFVSPVASETFATRTVRNAPRPRRGDRR